MSTVTDHKTTPIL